MTRDYPARTERDALCDLFAELGPDQPTLCEGWTTRDLAAHLIVRDRRPDAALGAVFKPLSRHTENLRAATARKPFDELISLVRQPPALSMSGPAVTDQALNTAEFFIHHEDARRGQADWAPRPLPPALARILYGQMKLVGRLRLRRFPARLTIRAHGWDEPVVTGTASGPPMELSGDVGELTMFLSGRQRATKVDIAGPDNLVERLRGTRLGL